MESREKGKLRSKSPKLWQCLLISCVLLGSLAVITSPGLGRKQDVSPEALIEAARQLTEEGEFVEAQKKYDLIISQKPQIPRVFTDAESEIMQVRLKALEAKKTAEDEAKKAEQAEKQSPKPDDTGTQDPEKQRPKPDEVPDVDLPELPDIGGM